ncbi:MAG: alanine dehydrogenase [Rhodospirillales bacterium]
MKIGVPKEIKNHEYRVGLTPASIAELVHAGHGAAVETGAGEGVGCTDADYRDAGAVIKKTAKQVFDWADMIVKVKEPQAKECKMLRRGQILFTYLHLAPDLEQTRGLIKSGAVCIAYETVTGPGGGLPLLAPMSQVAGRMSVQAGAHYLEKEQGGRGVLLGGVPGVPPGRVVVLGGGVVGANAVEMALGLGARVAVLDNNAATLERLAHRFGPALQTVFSNRHNLEHYVLDADLVIGGVLIPGAAAPKLVTRKMIKAMRPGSVVVDVAIDQGGCIATAKPTTHADPVYSVDGVIHYCVANMPGAVARTSAFALNNVTLPFALQLANRGYRKALYENPHLRAGLNVHEGAVTNAPVAEALKYKFVDPMEAIRA